MLYFHVCQSHSFVITFPLRTFATMKKFLSLIIAVACISTTTAQAQFYTVGNSKHRYKVKVYTPYIEKEAPQFRDTSSINILPTDSATLESKTSEQQNASNFCLSSPLRSIYITSPFGYRKDPFTAKRKFHNGIDLRANYELCYAMLDGVVERIGFDKRSGNFITLRHGNYTISYCHLSKIIVTNGTALSFKKAWLFQKDSYHRVSVDYFFVTASGDEQLMWLDFIQYGKYRHLLKSLNFSKVMKTAPLFHF